MTDAERQILRNLLLIMERLELEEQAIMNPRAQAIQREREATLKLLEGETQ